MIPIVISKKWFQKCLTVFKFLKIKPFQNFPLYSICDWINKNLHIHTNLNQFYCTARHVIRSWFHNTSYAIYVVSAINNNVKRLTLTIYVCDWILENSSKITHMKYAVFLHVFNDLHVIFLSYMNSTQYCHI